jgi:hypothetical protein
VSRSTTSVPRPSYFVPSPQRQNSDGEPIWHIFVCGWHFAPSSKMLSHFPPHQELCHSGGAVCETCGANAEPWCYDFRMSLYPTTATGAPRQSGRLSLKLSIRETCAWCTYTAYTATLHRLVIVPLQIQHSCGCGCIGRGDPCEDLHPLSRDNHKNDRFSWAMRRTDTEASIYTPPPFGGVMHHLNVRMAETCDVKDPPGMCG